MTKEQVLAELGEIQKEALGTKEEIRCSGPTLIQIVRRRDLSGLTSRLDEQANRLAAVTDEINRHTGIPGSYNERVMVAAAASIMGDARESAQRLLDSAYSDVAAIRSQLNFYASLCVSLIALAVSAISAFSG